jgi:DNA-binding MarR family transcriptional regulator
MADRMGYLLRRASGMMMADLGASLATIGLRPVEGTILLLVKGRPNCTQSELGRALGIKRANMAPLMATLVKKGLIDRFPADGRSQALTLSDAGERLSVEVEAIIDAHEARFELLLKGHDIHHVKQALHAMTKELRDQSG